MAAFAGIAAATTPEAVAYGAKQATGSSSTDASASPFAAMLAQWMSGTSLQGANTASSTPSPGSALPIVPSTSASPTRVAEATETSPNYQALMSVPASTSALPSRVPSYAQSLGEEEPVAPPLAHSFLPLVPPAINQTGQTQQAVNPSFSAIAPTTAQQAANTWLQQMMATSQAAMTPALPTLAQRVPAGSVATNVQMAAQQAAAAWIQQTAASGLQAGSQALQTLPPALPNAMSAAAAGSSAQPSVSQAPDLLQQIIAASVRASGSTSAQPMSNLPVGVQSYASSIAQSQPLFAGIASAAQAILPQSQSASAQTSAAQATASANAGPWVSAAPTSTILAANNVQSVAAMFGVPAFSPALAYAPPAKFGFVATGNSGSSATSSASTQVNSPTPTIQLTPATAAPGSIFASATAAQSSTSVAAGTPSSEGAANANTDKAAVLAQAVQDSVRQGHTAAVTEAQTLPLHFDLADAVETSRPAGSHDTSDTEVATEPEAQATPAQVPPAPMPTPTEHPASSPPQPSTAPTAPDPSSPTPSAFIGTPGSSIPAQQAPQTMTTALPQTPLFAAPDLNALAMSIASKSIAGARQFDIRLDPAELGRVDVRLSLDSSGVAQAHLAAERPETLALLQSNSNALTQALHDSGVQVASNGLQFSLKGQERQTDGQPRQSARGRAGSTPPVASIDVISSAQPGFGLSPSGSGVNILV